ncbi:MAG: LysR family transcriptional regulator [Acetobacterium sp. MES1]|jgi:DNA-binding transcriptional LysR family regulator|uniref:LysR family transcriptional regulator n=1 Tax=unclassified Acetobacterium TaxID=2638182 RepID=UPI000B9D0A8E|nr:MULTISPECIES: LysR family transcriptional regulator [unclassified Acetobacterium]OXS25989.1 MAG: LysR family transcriptional regulator [Acetobacterium sp. MES1]
MEYHQLKYFQKLADIGNYTKAADELNLSQSALSRSILRLEEEIGVPLFLRKSRGVVLNRYGRIFLKSVNQAIMGIDEAKREITNLVDPTQGSISLGFIQPLGSSYIPDLISAFQKENPGIKFQLNQDNTRNILAGIESGEIDVGFCSPPEEREGLTTLHIMDQELFLVVPKSHPLSDRTQIDLHELAGDSFILFKPESSLHDVIAKLFQDAGFRPMMSFEVYDERTVAGLVGANLGVALIPFFPGLDKKKISQIPVGKPNCSVSNQMVYQTDGYISPVFAQFKSFVESTLNQEHE